MRKILIFAVLVMILAIPVSAVDIEAPEVPESGKDFMPSNQETFADGLMEVLHDAIAHFQPDLKEASGVCLGVIAASMAVSVIQSMPGMTKKTADIAGAIAVSVILLKSANSLINLGAETVAEISEYGKLLLPVMTAAMAAQGGVTASTAIYTGTAFFDALLSSLISKLLTPMLYLLLALAAANSAVGEDVLKKLRDTMKWLMTWSLKIILYVFTGYIGITGVVSGSTDAATLKAAKLTISGMVPVVGGILSDASEAVLVSVGAVKNAAGIYGIFAILAVFLGPFLKIGAHYLMLKATAAVCGVFGSKRITDLIQDFSGAMGLVLAMTGTVCLMLMISTFCFMKGVG